MAALVQRRSGGSDEKVQLPGLLHEQAGPCRSNLGCNGKKEDQAAKDGEGIISGGVGRRRADFSPNDEEGEEVKKKKKK